MYNKLISNPLVCVVIVLFVLLIILGLIIIINPGFNAQVKGHFSSLNGQFNIEGFRGKDFNCMRKCHDKSKSDEEDETCINGC